MSKYNPVLADIARTCMHGIPLLDYIDDPYNLRYNVVAFAFDETDNQLDMISSHHESLNHDSNWRDGEGRLSFEIWEYLRSIYGYDEKYH